MVDPSPETKDAVLAVATSAADTGGAAHPDPSIAGQAEQASNDRREADDDDGASQLRRFIGRQAGGNDKLRVPPDDASIPLPPEDPTRPGRYRTTEAKRYLGKLLFHDPVRTARININEGRVFAGRLPELEKQLLARNAEGERTRASLLHMAHVWFRLAEERVNETDESQSAES